MKRMIFLLVAFLMLLTFGCGDSSSNDDNVVNGEGTKVVFKNMSSNEVIISLGEDMSIVKNLGSGNEWIYELSNETIQNSWDEDENAYFLSYSLDGKFIINDIYNVKLEVGAEVTALIEINAASLKIKNVYEDKLITGVLYKKTDSYDYNEIKLEKELQYNETANVQILAGEYDINVVYDDESTGASNVYTLMEGIETSLETPQIMKVKNNTNAKISFTIDYKYSIDVEAHEEGICEFFPKQNFIAHIEILGLYTFNQSYDLNVGVNGTHWVSVDPNIGVINVTNSSSRRVKAVFVSQDTNNWGGSKGSINPNASMHRQFAPGTWNIKLVDENDVETVYLNQNVDINFITEILFDGR